MKEQIFKRFIESIESGPFTALQNNGDIKAVVEKEGNNKDIYYCAVYQGYLDMCRTLSYSTKKHDRNKVFSGLEKLSKEISEYFCGDMPQESGDFDTKYKNSFLNAFVDTNMTIGQQQKVINMTFKYLFCCDDIRKESEGYFKFCHMPLDSFILNWYNHVCVCEEDKISEKWSNIDDINLYQSIVKSIRSQCKNEIVLVSEFDIWEKEKLLANLKLLRSSIEGIKNSNLSLNICIPNLDDCKKCIANVKQDLGYLIKQNYK